VRVREHRVTGQLVGTAVIPKDRSQRLRERIKGVFVRPTIATTLADRLRLLNPMLRGWCNFYRHAWGAKHVFAAIDHYVWWTIFRWLKKKHPRASMQRLAARYGWRRPRARALRWRDEFVAPYQLAYTPVYRFRLGCTPPVDFASSSMESPVHNERCTPGLGRGAQKPPGASRERR
jgi:RNA-directed DNA polymerase